MPSTFTSRLEGLTTSVAVKAPCRVATTAAVTLSGLQTIDGVALSAGDRVLVKSQSSTIDNGIWIASVGAWTRAADFDGTLDAVGGTQTMVIAGSANANTYWRVDGAGDVDIGQDGITFEAALISDSATQTFLQSGTGAEARSVQSKLRDYVCVLDFIPASLHAAIAAGTDITDHTDYFQNAADTGKPVYAPKGKYSVGVAWPVIIASNFELFGDGESTIIQNGPAAAYNAFYCDSASADPDNNLTGIYFHDLMLDGMVATDGFSEQRHLIRISGVTGMLVERVTFKGFRGDGFYIGSGDTAGVERHNYDIVVRDCIFDGVNNENRQGISVLDIDGLLIENCRFDNCTKSTMPGCIDFEPNAANTTAILKNITIRKNKFIDCGGNIGDIAFIINAAIVAIPSHVTIEDNTFSGGSSATATNIRFQIGRTPDDETADQHIRIVGNKGTGGVYPFRLLSGCGITVEGNSWDDYPLGPLVGYSGGTDTVRDVKIVGNTFTRVGSAAAANIGLVVFKADVLSIEENSFIDCGDGLSGSCSIQFNTGASTEVDISRNRFSAPTAKTLTAVVKGGGHTLTASGNRFADNVILDSIATGSFSAYDGDLVNTFTPVIEGVSTAGAGTYSSNVHGYFQKRGKFVDFSLVVEATAHTGTGQIEVSLPPIAPAAKSDNAPMRLIVSGAGMAYTSGEVPYAFLQTSGSTAVGSGSIRLGKMAASGTTATMTIAAATTMTINLAGTYEAA